MCSCVTISLWTLLAILTMCHSFLYRRSQNGPIVGLSLLIRPTTSAATDSCLNAKASSEAFYCTDCGTEHIKWAGRCTACKEWNTIKEMKISRATLKPLDTRSATSHQSPTWLPQTEQSGRLIEMSSVDLQSATERFQLDSVELNRVLGGGLVRGSVVLLAGEPGIGKSTLIIQMAHHFASQSMGRVVYVSGEENPQQIVARANRLHLSTNNIFLICGADTDHIVETIQSMSGASPVLSRPMLIIVDSVQTLKSSSSPNAMGSVSQIRDSTSLFVQIAKSTGSIVLLAGHVTKSGEVAGPRVLEHMVDTVLYMEGNERSEHRLLRSQKNRFGSTSEVGVFSMTERGLVDVDNPSELFFSGFDAMEDGLSGRMGVEGACVAVLMEGSRPLLAEIQSLVNNHPSYANSAGRPPIPAKRASDGFPIQRLLLICAVVEKRLGLSLHLKDIYLNVVGGLRVSEPSADLAVAMSVLSSALEEPIIARTAFIGELGLGGELRGSKRIEDRVREAIKLGFTRIIIPAVTKRTKASHSEEYKLHHSINQLKTNASVDYQRYILECSNILEVVALAFVNPDVVSSMKQKHRRKRSALGGSKQQSQPSELNGYEEYSMDPSFEDEMGNESGEIE